MLMQSALLGNLCPSSDFLVSCFTWEALLFVLYLVSLGPQDPALKACLSVKPGPSPPG